MNEGRKPLVFFLHSREVGVQAFHDLLVVDLAVADAVDSGEGHGIGLFVLGDELGGRSLALGAEFGGIVAFVDIAADAANVLHNSGPFFHAPFRTHDGLD